MLSQTSASSCCMPRHLSMKQMLRSLILRERYHGCHQTSRQSWLRRSLTTPVRQQDEPLRILFCGSEGFSITALEALCEYQKSRGSNVLSIDVATRKDKAGGRGMKELRSPPIKRVAARLGLRVHQFDTFTGWHPPEYGDSPQPYINLVVAVSFGLLVPPRILNNAKFGGINVHPSMLPDLRGAAPINWTIIQGYSHTGVTVQTLHPSKFDHGTVLAQSRQPGLAIPNADQITAHELRHLLAPIGAQMLVNTIHDKLYLQPYPERIPNHSTNSATRLTLAPKITPVMKSLDPYNDQISTILRKNRAIPKLWAEVRYPTDNGEQIRRIIFGTRMRAATEDDLSRNEIQRIVDDMPIGIPFALIPPNADIYQTNDALYLKVKDGILAVPELVVAGGREGPAAAAAAHAKLFASPIEQGKFKVYRFQHGLEKPDANA